MYSFKSEVSFLIFRACSFIELMRFEKVSNCSFYLCRSLFISLSRFSLTFKSWYLLRGFVKGLKIEFTIWTFEGVCVITFSIFIGWIISLFLRSVSISVFFAFLNEIAKASFFSNGLQTLVAALQIRNMLRVYISWNASFMVKFYY